LYAEKGNLVILALIVTGVPVLVYTIVSFYIYILTTKNNKMFYIGVTSHLFGRIKQHKSKELKGFSNKYNINKLVYFEEFLNVYDAITREKKLKNWHRFWKINLIKSINPKFNDLSKDWFQNNKNLYPEINSG